MQTETQARQANIKEWAELLLLSEIEWLLSERRSHRTQEEIKALVKEEQRRAKMAA